MAINFSENQKTAIEQAVTLFNGDKGGIQVICGYAGAGKTTILKEIVRSAGVAKVIAPTNRAVKVIEQKLGAQKGNELCSTVHKFFNNNKIYDSEFTAEYGLSIVVDESSMLNNEVLDAFEYGVKKYNWKVALVGDGAQLPPIEKLGVQSRNFLARGYNTVELTEVFRQKDGDLLDFVTRVRLQRLTGVDKESAHVKVMNQTEAIEAFLSDYQAGIPIMGLAWRNTTRLKLNQTLIQKLNIREYNDSRFQYVAVNNTEEYKNGETFFFERETEVLAEKKISLVIKEVASPLKQTNTQSVPPRVVETNAVFLKHGDIKYILLPECAEPTVTSYDIVGNTIPQELWADWTSEKIAANGKRYRNISPDCIVCEPGLILTVHKAQGSQWEKVYIFESAMNDTRWFYTACTRAEQDVIVVDGGGNKTAAKVLVAEEKACGSKNAPIGYYTGAKPAEELQGAELVFYTSSFTQLKKLPEAKRNLAFAVSGGLPKEADLAWVRRISDVNPNPAAKKALIPDYGTIVKPYLQNRMTEEQYVQKFMKQLEKVSPLDVLKDGMILCCYEPINKFCHRHLIAKWAEDWGRAHGVKIMYGGEYFDKNRQAIESKEAIQEQKAESKEAKQETVSVDKRFAGIICQFTEEQIVQYADRVLEVARTVKEKSGNGDSEFTDLILSFTADQIRGCADLIAQAAKQFV